VKGLLEDPGKRAGEGKGSRPTQEGMSAGRSARGGVPGWAWGVIAGIVIAACAYFAVSRKPETPPPAAAAEAKPAAIPAPAAPKADDKSIAVLPFDNMSDDKDNAFFTDGIQEDILTNLALVHEIRVVSRTSVERYRDTKKPIGQIATELGVTYVLEGSVRRAGNKVRVTGQLIHASTDEHVWAKAYDRDLTDIFAIQSELAQDIAAELKAALSPEEKAILESKPTQNTEAYDLYLRARSRDEIKVDEAQERQDLLQKAVALDPSFARAWAELAHSYAFRAFHFQEGTDEFVAKATEAINKAVQLAPDDPDIISAQGDYYYYAHRDYARANAQYQKLALQRPNDAGVYASLGLIQRRQGRWAESLVNLRRATELDVANAGYLNNLIASLETGRRYDELRAAWQKMAALKPGELDPAYKLAQVSFHATGSTREVEDFLANLTPEEANSQEGISVRQDWAQTIGDDKELIRLERFQPYNTNTPFQHWEQDVLAARTLFLSGDKDGALARLGKIPEELPKRIEREPKNARLWFFRANVDLIEGRPMDAVNSVKRSLELYPESTDALEAPVYSALGAQVCDYAGDTEHALAEYTRLLRRPGNVLSVTEMRRDTHSRLRGDPRFEALLNDPANNAPLF
jgi:TolB-like protein/Tfp pilus assembly protein PilF